MELPIWLNPYYKSTFKNTGGIKRHSHNPLNVLNELGHSMSEDDVQCIWPAQRTPFSTL